MIIYLCGPDAYYRQEKLNWYIRKFREKHTGLTIERFDLAEKGGADKLRDFATAQSLFIDFKFGILENFSSSEPKDTESTLRMSLGSKNLTLVVSVEKPLPKPFKIFSEAEVIRHDFSEQKPAELASLIRIEAAKRGLKLSPALMENLLRSYPDNTWGLVTELDKLSLGGSAEEFTGERNFFALTNVLQSGGPASYKIPALERLLADGDPAMLFNFLASRADLETKTKMADFDVAIKSGKLEYEEALTGLALGF